MSLLPDSQPAASGCLASYALTSAGDAPERDPADWVLEGLPVADATASTATAVNGAMQQPLAASGGRQQPAGSEAAAAAAAAGQPAAAATWAALPDDRPEGLSAAAAPAAAKATAAATPTDGRGRGALQGWRVLDAREGVRFGSRGCRLQFQVLPSVAHMCKHIFEQLLHRPMGQDIVLYAGTGPSLQSLTAARKSISFVTSKHVVYLAAAAGCGCSISIRTLGSLLLMTPLKSAAAEVCSSSSSERLHFGRWF